MLYILFTTTPAGRKNRNSCESWAVLCYPTLFSVIKSPFCKTHVVLCYPALFVFRVIGVVMCYLVFSVLSSVALCYSLFFFVLFSIVFFVI